MGFEERATNNSESTPREKTPREVLLQGLLEMSKEINGSLPKEKFPDGLVDEKGKVRMRAFSNVLSEDEIASDEEEVLDDEKGFSGAEIASRRAFLKDKFCPERKEELTEQEAILLWKEEREGDKSGQMEMLMTLLLHKNLGERFMVVRSSDYDDYSNGVDNLIIDRKTGEIICAFDEVVDSPRSDRPDKKQGKVLEKVKRGGAELKYGATFENGELKLKSLEGLPLFVLALESSEIGRFITKMRRGDELNGDEEKALIRKLMESILKQKETFSAIPGLLKSMRNSLAKVDKMVEAIKGML